MRGTLVTVLAALALAAGAGAQRAQDPPMDRLRWLAGCWELQRGERVTLEMWMPPAGGLMLGASRTVVAGAVRETELLRIEGRPDGLVYIAVPSGQRETVFTAAAVTDSGFTVANPTHDFPQRIIYRRRGADSLIARIEGPGRDGGVRGIDFPMRRVRCEVF
ncbi:MAG TPA: DUF6265 family protein [Gemmatimonadaceae bacterium]|nr:DUF6265 family protein [Gemmatimonadaceae bacterium]